MSQYGKITDFESENIVNITSIDNTDSPYTALDSDYYISCDVSSGSVTIKLPDSPVIGRIYITKDSSGNSESNYITIESVSATVEIDGELSKIINMDFKSLNFIFNGQSWEIF